MREKKSPKRKKERKKKRTQLTTSNLTSNRGSNQQQTTCNGETNRPDETFKRSLVGLNDFFHILLRKKSEGERKKKKDN